MDTAIKSSVYVTSPEYAGWLMKRGFRWRKKWKKRWVALHGMELVYMDKEPTSDNISEITVTKTLLSAGCTVVGDDDPDGEEFGFSVHTNDPKAEVWYLRAESRREKNFWMMRLKYALAIVEWMDAFEKVRVLGIGVSGIVHELRHKVTDQRFALKEMEIKSSYQMQMAIQEATMLKDIMEHVSHPNIMHIEKVFQVGSKFFMVFPLCLGGELFEHIVARGHFSEADASKLMLGIVSGLNALHDNDILHLDIKPENILFESKEPSSNLKITDFGLSRITSKEEDSREPSVDEPFTRETLAKELAAYQRTGVINTKRMKGTIGYMSPELILCGHQSKAADVFAAGVILYVLLSGSPPFKGSGNRDVLNSTVTGKYVLSGGGWDSITEEGKDLVRRMLCPFPDERITTKEILEHPWLTRFSRTSTDDKTAVPVKNLAETLQQLSGHVRSMRSEKMALNMTRLLSLMQMEKQTSPLSEACLGGIAFDDENDSDDGPNDSEGIKAVSPEEVFQSMTSGDIKSALARVIARLNQQPTPYSGDTKEVAAEHKLDVDIDKHVRLPIEKFIILLESMQAISQSSLRNSVGLLLFSRFIDRDGDGYITIDDIIAVHVMIARRSESFVKLVFRLYAEALWYPGKHLNVMKIMSETQKPPLSTPDKGLPRKSRSSEKLSIIDRSEPSLSSSTTGNDSTVRGSAVLSDSGSFVKDVIEPPKVITEKHVAAVFEKLGFDPSKGHFAFKKLCEVLAKIRDTEDAPYHSVQDAVMEEMNDTSAEVVDPVPVKVDVAATTCAVEPPVDEEVSKIVTTTKRAESIDRTDTGGTVNSSSMERDVEYKMDERLFLRATEIDDVLVHAVLRRTRGKLMRLLSRAKTTSVESGGKLSVADVLEEEIIRSMDRVQQIHMANSESLFSALGSATAAIGRAAQGLFFSPNDVAAPGDCDLSDGVA